MNRSLLIAVLAGIIVNAGCGDGGVPLAEVEGTVKAEGQPLDKIQVEFWPLTQGPRSIGTTDAQGKYKLMTDDGNRSGAAIGSHKVVLKDLGIFKDEFKVGREAAESGESISSGKKSRIPGKYSDAQNSPLTKEVTAGSTNVLDLEVTP